MLDLIRQESQLQQSLAYNYDQVDAANRPAVIAAALEIKPRLQRASDDLIAVGQQLNAAKDLLPHGQFGDWLEQEFNLTGRMAQHFMNVAERFGDKSETVSLLSNSVLYLLAAPSTPEAAVAELVEAANTSGHSPTKAEATEVIAKHRPAKEINYAPVHMQATGWAIEKLGETHWRVRIPYIKDPKQATWPPGLASFDEALAAINTYYDARQVVIADAAQSARPSEAPAPPARPFNFIAATPSAPRALTKEETLAVVARGLAAARPTGSNADQIAWLAASQLADFTPLLTARVFIDPTYLAQAKRQLEADLKSRSKTSEPVFDPADPTTMVAPPDLAAHGWTLRKTADKWWGHVPQGNRATAMFSDVPSAVAAMRAMQANLAPPAAPSARLEIEALITLYSDVIKTKAAYTRITGESADHLEYAITPLIQNLKKALAPAEGRPTL